MPVDLRGKLVDLEGDNFVFVKRPDAETTINRAALRRIDNLATKSEREFVIAVDYGFSSDEFREVLQGAQHRTLDSPFRTNHR